MRHTLSALLPIERVNKATLILKGTFIVGHARMMYNEGATILLFMIEISK